MGEESLVSLNQATRAIIAVHDKELELIRVAANTLGEVEILRAKGLKSIALSCY